MRANGQKIFSNRSLLILETLEESTTDMVDNEPSFVLVLPACAVISFNSVIQSEDEHAGKCHRVEMRNVTVQ